MTDYKIDSAIVLPPIGEPSTARNPRAYPEVDRRLRRGPGRRKRCHNADHVPMHGKCSICGDIFPCEESCIHVDCLEDKGLPLPEWIAVSTTPELACKESDSDLSLIHANDSDSGDSL